MRIPRRGTGARRAGWILVLAGLVSGCLSFLAPTAHADGVLATFAGMGAKVDLVGTKKDGNRIEGVPAGVMRIKIGGQEYAGYCIDFDTLAINSVDQYQESSWDAANLGSDLPRINWVLHNGYPNRTAAFLSEKAQTTVSDAEAAAATQAAIWFFSDGFALDDGANPANVLALYHYLTGPDNGGLAREPVASVSIVEDHATGVAGTRVGPFTIATTSDAVSLTSDNATFELVKEDGTAVTSAADGDKVFVNVPAGTEPGSLTITASATATVKTGRVFVKKGDPSGMQKLILAAAATGEASDVASASWTAAPTPKPDAVAHEDCVAGGVRVSVSNTGDASGVFTVRGPGGFEQTVEVAAGGSSEVLVPVAEDATYAISVEGPAGFTKSFTGTLHCALAVTATPNCSEGGVVVGIRNDGDVPASVKVAPGGGVEQTVTVAPGEQQDVLVPVANGAAYTIQVTAGSFARTLTGTLDCAVPPPAVTVSAAPSCADGGVRIAVRNEGDTATQVRVTSVGGTEVVRDLAPGAGDEVLVAVAADHTYDITVTGPGLEKRFTGTLSCGELSAVASPACAENGIRVDITNAATKAVTFVVAEAAGFRNEVAVAAGATGSVVVPVADGATYTITVTAGSYVQTLSGASTCVRPVANPSASAAPRCTDRSVVVTLRNTGTAPALFAVTSDSGFNQSVEISPNANQDIVVPVPTTGGYVIVVRSGAYVQTFAATQMCTEVQGGQTLPTPAAPVTGGSLPVTGAQTGALLVLAMVFIGGGALLLVIQDVTAPRPATRRTRGGRSD